ncbi:hypothetical protein GGX14DRAFT_634366 [Mycena pura]|uniref:Clp1-like protein n=1 Tax=Mycena pura TaxID=153505 RepID=A0AAD6VEZ8_9AGAR|nr:hypothetical protein GGX14DRAFT_634366 [Mycena pura]
MQPHSESDSVRAGPSSIQLPRTLGRPPVSKVSRAALLAASPDLGHLSVDDIRKTLLENASQMLASTSALSPSHLPAALPKDCLPPYLTVPVLPDRHCPCPSFPTHILAVSTARASASASSPSAATDIHLIFPIHAPILAAHCSKLPVLPTRAPRARPDTSAAAAVSVHLPVLPLALPSAPAFAVLLGWMYTRRLGAVLSALLAFPASDPFLRRLELTLTPKAVRAALASRSDRHALAAHVCAAAAGDVAGDVAELMTHTAHVKELWQDMVALGIDDDALWDTLQLAYEIVLGALNLAVLPK